jgi:hypothetical protein
MPQVGFKPRIPMFELAKTVHALGGAANVIGICIHIYLHFFIYSLIVRSVSGLRFVRHKNMAMGLAGPENKKVCADQDHHQIIRPHSVAHDMECVPSPPSKMLDIEPYLNPLYIRIAYIYNFLMLHFMH